VIGDDSQCFTSWITGVDCHQISRRRADHILISFPLLFRLRRFPQRLEVCFIAWVPAIRSRVHEASVISFLFHLVGIIRCQEYISSHSVWQSLMLRTGICYQLQDDLQTRQQRITEELIKLPGGLIRVANVEQPVLIECAGCFDGEQLPTLLARIADLHQANLHADILNDPCDKDPR
jgi:hypothetical protein